ncbi:hypothetical protein OC835_008069, partial [Tilletia horrida]
MAKMESLLSHLAAGVDFTDTLGPPVVLPDAGNRDNPDDPTAHLNNSSSNQPAATSSAADSSGSSNSPS